jgi:hypothetical protein
MVSAIGIGAVIAAGSVARFSYAPMPDERDLLNPARYPLSTAYDILGRRVARDEAEQL